MLLLALLNHACHGFSKVRWVIRAVSSARLLTQRFRIKRAGKFYTFHRRNSDRNQIMNTEDIPTAAALHAQFQSILSESTVWIDWPNTWNFQHFLLIMTLLVFVVLCRMESKVPQFRYSRRVNGQSYLTNLVIFTVNNVLLCFASVSALFLLAEKYALFGEIDPDEYSLIAWLGLFLVIDFSMYLWHFANHRIPILWMFHKIHHSDQCVNVSTALRFHIGELVLTVLYKCLLIVIVGVTEHVLVAAQLVTLWFVMFHHANISFRGEKLLSRIFVVPSLHRTHHASDRMQHDSNYGSILSVWDRLFGTLNTTEPESIGLPRVEQQTAWQTFLFAFRTRRRADRRLTETQPCSNGSVTGTTLRDSDSNGLPILIYASLTQDVDQEYRLSQLDNRFANLYFEILHAQAKCLDNGFDSKTAWAWYAPYWQRSGKMALNLMNVMTTHAPNAVPILFHPIEAVLDIICERKFADTSEQ